MTDTDAYSRCAASIAIGWAETPEERRDAFLRVVRTDPDWRWSESLCEMAVASGDPSDQETGRLGLAEVVRIHGPADRRGELEARASRVRFPALARAIDDARPAGLRATVSGDDDAAGDLATEVHDLVHTHDHDLVARVVADLGGSDLRPRAWTASGWVASLAEPPGAEPFAAVDSTGADRVRDLARSMALRPGMHLSPPSWATADAFWAGYGSSSDAAVLAGFPRWVERRINGARSGWTHFTILRAALTPEIGRSDPLERDAAQQMFGLVRDCLEAYLDECGGPA